MGNHDRAVRREDRDVPADVPARHDREKPPIVGPFVTAPEQSAVAALDVLMGAAVARHRPRGGRPDDNRAISFSHKIAYGLYRVTAAPENNWAKVGATYILAKNLAESVFKAAKAEAFELVMDVPGEQLSGLTAAHPLRGHGYDFDVPLLDGDHVTDDAGTGFVHTAPGHGREDFDVWM
eukprot:gene48993-66513_t